VESSNPCQGGAPDLLTPNRTLVEHFLKWHTLLGWEPEFRAQGCEFVADFGPFHSGERYYQVTVDFMTGQVSGLDWRGETQKRGWFKIVAEELP